MNEKIKDIFIFAIYMLFKKPVQILKLFFYGSRSTIQRLNTSKMVIKTLFVIFLITLATGNRRLSVGVAILMVLFYLRWEWMKKDWKGEYRKEKYDRLVKKAKQQDVS